MRIDRSWLYVSFALTAVMLVAACTTQQPSLSPTLTHTSPLQPTGVPAQEIPTSTISVQPTPSFTSKPSAMPTGTITITSPTQESGPTLRSSTTPTIDLCNQAEFLGDVAIPDGTVLSPGEIFFKIWRLKNTGTCPWLSYEYDLVFSYGDQMSGPDSAVALFFPLGLSPQPILGDSLWANPMWQVEQGDVVDIPLFLKAPDEPGTFLGHWKLLDSSGVVVSRLWVLIMVEDEVARGADDWSGEWLLQDPTIQGAEKIVSMGLAQSSEGNIFGFLYNHKGYLMLVDGAVREDGKGVIGTFGEPWDDGISFEWKMLDNLNQFQGVYRDSGFSAGVWCGGRGYYLPPFDNCVLTEP